MSGDGQSHCGQNPKVVPDLVVLNMKGSLQIRQRRFRLTFKSVLSNQVATSTWEILEELPSENGHNADDRKDHQNDEPEQVD